MSKEGNTGKRELWYANFQELVSACIPEVAPLAAGMPIEEAALRKGLSRLIMAHFDELEHDLRMQGVIHRSLVTYVHWLCDEGFTSPPACINSVSKAATFEHV